MIDWYIRVRRKAGGKVISPLSRKSPAVSAVKARKLRSGRLSKYLPALTGSFILFHFAIPDVNDAVSIGGDFQFVGDENDGIALRVKALE